MAPGVPRRWLNAAGVVAVTAAALTGTSPVAAQFAIGGGLVAQLYERNCAACHGAALNGGSGGSLVDDAWVHGGDDDALTRSIAVGYPDAGMPGYADALSPEEIRSLVIFIREAQAMAAPTPATQPSADGVYTSRDHDFTVETLFEADGIFWAVAFLPDDALLVSRRDGTLFQRDAAGETVEIADTPEVWRRGQGGLLDIGVHPDYADNGWIYLSYASTPGEDGPRAAGNTKVVRGRITDGRWTDEAVIFETPGAHHGASAFHFGSRFVFREGYLYFSIGDRGRPDNAQDLGSPAGKVHRIHDDGRIPQDNPFIMQDGAYPSVWTYGNRNPQGMAWRPGPDGGALYAVEHGPRGGDELNRLEARRNYGWPVITYGMNYNGAPLTHETARAGLEQPLVHWTPSIAVSGMAFYKSDAFEGWAGDALIGGLAAQELRRVRLDASDGVVEQEVLLKNQGRVRDVAVGPDGAVYVTTQTSDNASSRVLRLRPVASPRAQP